MNGLDILIVIFVAIGLFRGVVRGLIKEVASIAGVFAGFYVAMAHYTLLAPWLEQYMRQPGANLVAFFVFFFGALIGIAAIGSILKYILRISNLGNVDKVFGGVLGLIKGVLVSAAIVFALTLFLPTGATFVQKSHLAPVVTKSSQVIISIIPKDVMDRVKTKASGLQDQMDNSNT